MPEPKKHPEPTLKELAQKLDRLDGKVQTLKESIPKPRELFRDWLWKERMWFFPLALTVLGGVFGGGGYLGVMIVDSRIDAKIKPLQSSIDKMSGAMGIASRDTVHTLSAAPPQELARHLPELREAITSARDKPIGPDPKELVTIKDKLPKVDQAAPGYWPVSFEIVNLVSRATFSGDLALIKPAGVIENSVGMRVERSSITLKGSILKGYFKDCVVRFDPHVQLINVTFENCVFVFPVSDSPPVPLQRITTSLLSADLSHPTTISNG